MPSLRGDITEKVNQLRDPNFFTDISDQMYMLYTDAGESGIGITSLLKTE